MAHTVTPTAGDDHLAATFDWLAGRYLEQTVQVSWGRYPAWMAAVARLAVRPRPHRLVDLGSGPGYLLRRVAARLPECELAAVDISARVLEAVPESVARYQAPMQVWAAGHARAYDVAVLSFVLRDLARPEEGIQAAATALRPGGRVIVLETHTPEGWRQWGFDAYFHHALPAWGDRFLTRDWPEAKERAPYRWLSETHRRWHRGEALGTWLEAAGFSHITSHRRPEDVVLLYSANLT